MPYQFPGIVQFIEAACDAVGLIVPADAADVLRNAINDQRHKAKSGWHLKSVIDVASQLPDIIARVGQGLAGDNAAPDAIARAELIIKGLEAQLVAAKAALAHAVEGSGVTPAPEPAPAEAPAEPVVAKPAAKAANGPSNPPKKGDAKP
jgi:hypothetical protein